MARTKSMPAILRRKRLGKDNITKRDWSKNLLGEAFVKAPERMELLKFYSTQERVGSSELYKQHNVLERKIRTLIKARPIRDMGIAILKGKRYGYYYVRISSNQTNNHIFIRIDKPSFQRGVRFLEEKGKASA